MGYEVEVLRDGEWLSIVYEMAFEQAQATMQIWRDHGWEARLVINLHDEVNVPCP